jgi:deoxyribonuclease-4
MQWLGKPYSPEDIAAYAKESAANNFACVFGHTGYLINLGGPACENRDRSIKSLIQETERATQLGLPFLVLHPGAHLGVGERAGLKQIVAGLNEVFAATKRSPVRIALENTAGQGSCLGNQIEHLAAIFHSVKKPERLGLCLDTPHFFAAGYDIRSPKGWNAAIREVGSLIGLKQVLAFHLNDSKRDLGSRVDRHDHIGKGKIGKAAFRHIVNDARFKKHPGCLETPKVRRLARRCPEPRCPAGFGGSRLLKLISFLTLKAHRNECLVATIPGSVWGEHPIAGFCQNDRLHSFLVMVVS